ncbi:MAG: DnaJ domain-containing protein [Cyanobacteria bacterium P01_A01_bin.84]
MDVVDCYRLLGLRSGASFADIKSSYRRLAHQYHPDINPNDNRAKEKFIALTEAYKLLLQIVPPQEISQQQASSQDLSNHHTTSVSSPRPEVKAKRAYVQQPLKKPQKKPRTQSQSSHTPSKTTPPKTTPPNTIEIEKRLKWKTYEQLQEFLRKQRFPQAIALAEALAQRLPRDTEVRQWQAISYQLWARRLIKDKQFLKARIYLKKALKTDPNNKSLINQVQQDFQKLKQFF